MQEIAVPGAADDLGRDGSLVVLSHNSTDLERGLEPGERVTLVDASAARRTAVVVDVEFELDDTTYVLRLGREAGVITGAETVESVVNLLHDLRRQRRSGS